MFREGGGSNDRPIDRALVKIVTHKTRDPLAQGVVENCPKKKRDQIA
jgi:hypothetical protein